MAHIIAKEITVDFPVYGTESRSLKKSIIRAATGGVLARDVGERIIVRALDRMSFEFHEGDRVGILGHNGSGKSTLLRVMAGIYEPVSGSIAIKGRVTSMLSISLGMDMEATGLENVFMRGYVMGVSKKRMKMLIDDIAEFSGIGDYLYLPMRTYSSGMAMRLAFSVSTCVDADIILMDEWLSVGDADFVDKAQKRLNQLINSASIVVLASHDPSLIQAQCNKVMNLEHGVLKF